MLQRARPGPIGPLVTAPALTSSAWSSSASPRRPSFAATASARTEISAVLSDAPAPDADPVGYALSQVRPLRAVRTGDDALDKLCRGVAS